MTNPASNLPAPAEEHALAESRFARLTTKSGFAFKVRRVEPFDKPALKQLFEHVTAEDMRNRFLSPLKQPSDELIEDMVLVDHAHKEDYLAFTPDEKTLIASAVVADDKAGTSAEVAIAMHSDFKNHGIGWTLLDYVADQARRRGIASLRSIESRSNQAVIKLESEMGFKISAYPGDASLVMLVFDLTKKATQEA